MRPSLRPQPILVLLLGTALAVSGCGGDDNSDGSDAPEPPAESKATPAEPTQAVAMSELKFSPSNVTAASDSTVAIRNEGKLGHDLKLRRNGKDVGGTPILNPGETQNLEVRYPPGRYEMYCSVPGHEDSGMKGTFTIE